MNLFLVECTHTSTGLGYELGTALAMNKPILAVAHKDAKVTRLVLGVTHRKYTFRRYDEMEDVVTIVDEKLKMNYE